jgi:hypothetical protein
MSPPPLRHRFLYPVACRLVILPDAGLPGLISPQGRYTGSSTRLQCPKTWLIVICLLAASVLIDFAHMVLSMIIDSVLAVAIVYFLWRINTTVS